ncbi:MoaD/ThiS family protein [uncultured Pontibacter sp.]|uniref:MoaD/ThiS family protein n=1 Tax=uncultured Pontibacter sp. TaxID=453356 RepID=UPI00260D951C|nr:MoaD/ThiS family protein [uncultured Pontibacter sp.]
MKITLFGMAKELVGQPEIYLEDTSGIKQVKDVKARLKKEYPAFEKLPTMAIAVNVNFAQDDDPVTDQDEVVVIPPVSGG